MSIALALVAAASLLPAVALFLQMREVSTAFSTATDSVSALERQISPFATALRGHAVAGYFSPRSDAKTDVAAARNRFIVQYSLAPTILVADSTQRLVVADCAEVPSCHALAGAAGLEVERDFGSGWLLLRRPVR